MHPPYAPADCARCARPLSDLRHDSRTRNVTASSGNPELVDMTRRFWIGLALPLLAVMVSDILPGHCIQHLLPGRWLGWVEFEMGDASRFLGRLALFPVELGVCRRSQSEYVYADCNRGGCCLYSVVAVITPALFPATFRDMSGNLGMYFGAASVIKVLVLFGQVLEFEGPQPDEQRDQGIARIGAKDGTTDLQRWARDRCCLG